MLRLIGIEEALENIKNDKGILIDIRSSEQYKEGHIPGAEWITFDEIIKPHENLPMNKELYLYCESGVHSIRATKILSEYGYSAVSIVGGISNYHGNLSRAE